MIKLHLFLTISFILVGCSKELTHTSMPVKAVKTLTITQSNLLSVRQISGSVASANTTEVSFRVSGLVTSLNVNIGDTVTAGQTLSTLEKREFELAIQSAQADLSGARATLAEKQDELVRQTTLKNKGFVTQSAIDQAKASFNTAKSNVLIAQNKLETAQNNLSYTIQKAPIDGVVASRYVDLFAEISAGQAIFELQSDNELEVELLVPETLISKIQYGDVVNVEFPSIEDTIVQATVTQIASKSDSGNAFPITVKLTEIPEQLRPGMTARVAFNVGEAVDTNVYLLPLSALDTRILANASKGEENQAPVFILLDNKAKRKLVTIRDIRGNFIEVTEGLNEGETVITAGVSFLHDGQAVKAWQPTYNLPATINQ